MCHPGPHVTDCNAGNRAKALLVAVVQAHESQKPQHVGLIGLERIFRTIFDRPDMGKPAFKGVDQRGRNHQLTTANGASPAQTRLRKSQADQCLAVG